MSLSKNFVPWTAKKGWLMILIILLLSSALWQLQAFKRGFWKPKAFSVIALWHCWKRENEKSKRSVDFLPAGVPASFHAATQICPVHSRKVWANSAHILSYPKAVLAGLCPCQCLTSLSRMQSSGFALSKDLSFLHIPEQLMPVCDIPCKQAFSLSSCKKGQAKLSFPGKTLA